MSMEASKIIEQPINTIDIADKAWSILRSPENNSVARLLFDQLPKYASYSRSNKIKEESRNSLRNLNNSIG